MFGCPKEMGWCIVQSSATPSDSSGDLQDGIRLTVAGAAARLGVAAPTLRTWARRYGLGPSGHVAGSHRRYDATDLARLETMRRLTLEGVAPADAAQIAMQHPGTDNGRGAPRADSPSVPVRDHRDGTTAVRQPQDDEPMVADPLTVAAAAVDGDQHRLARLVRRAGRDHGLLEGWLMVVQPAAEMVAQRPQPDQPGHDPELLLRAQMMAELTAAAIPARTTGRALVQFVPAMRTDAHVLATELATRGVGVQVAHERLEAHQGEALLELAGRHEDTVTVLLGESAFAEHLVHTLCARGQQVFLVALTDAIEPRPGLHRARTLTGAMHEIMSLLT